MENENGRTRIQLDGPIHSMAESFETRIENLEKSIPPSVPSRNNKKSKKGSKKRKSVTFDNSNDEDLHEGKKGKKFCQYYGTCGHTTDQCTTLKALVKQAKQKKSRHFDKKKSFTKHEVKVMVQKQVKKALKKKKRKLTEELHAFMKMCVSDLDQESMNSSSSEEGEVWKLGSGKLFNFNKKHSSKKLKQHVESFLNLDYCINANCNYESLCSRLVSKPNSNKNYKNLLHRKI